MKKVALITGGASGMGRLAAINLCKKGMKVAILDLNEDGLNETSEQNVDIHPWKVDTTDFSALEAVIKEVESKLGPIDCVYNAAGIMPLGKILDQNPEVVRKVMDVNYGGLVNISKLTIPGMVERGHGDFVSFASMIAWAPALMTGAYCASKFAVLAYTEILYHENRNKGVRIVCVCPPLAATPLLNQARDTTWPKMLDVTPPVDPQIVIKAIDKGLAKGNFWIFPGTGTFMGALTRRFLPGLLWKFVHKTEGF